MAAVCRDGLPDTVAIEVHYLRPVFWADAIDIEGQCGPDGIYTHFRAANRDGKTVADLRVVGNGN